MSEVSCFEKENGTEKMGSAVWRKTERSNMKVFCFTCGNTQAQVVATKGEYNLVECTRCGCRWRRSLDPLYERTALVEVDEGERIAMSAVPPRARAAEGGDKVPLGCNDSMGMLFEQRNVIY